MKKPRAIPLRDWIADIQESNFWEATPRQRLQTLNLLKGGYKIKKMTHEEIEKMEKKEEQEKQKEELEEVIVEDENYNPIGTLEFENPFMENPFQDNELNAFI